MSNEKEIVTICGNRFKHKIVFQMYKIVGGKKIILWKTEYSFKDGFPLEQSDMDYIAHRIEKNFIRDGVISKNRKGLK